MEISCNSCGKKINLPDEKVPQGKSFNVVCPQCKNKIIVEQGAAPSANSPEGTAAVSPAVTQFQPPEDEAGLDFSEGGQKTALVCDDKNKDIVKSALNELDYRVSIASSSEDAINKMRFTLYDVILLNEEFDKGTPENNAVLKYIQPMAMPTRRKIFFAMLGKNFRTLDNMTAFVKSANMVINIKDLQNLKNIIKKSVADNEAFYKVFKETLREAGKV
ncbi:MAG: zinc-ribbon domain-containing protein [Nitrospinae bacterium]|nr:zinc-ribbon domain-containing protein [Nitrospinota bacterium]